MPIGVYEACEAGGHTGGGQEQENRQKRQCNPASWAAWHDGAGFPPRAFVVLLLVTGVTSKEKRVVVQAEFPGIPTKK